MEARVVEFAEVLRQNGVRVSTSEVLDGARAVALVDLSERDNLRSVLRTTLVKRSADVEVFDRAFGLFFSGALATLEALETSLLASLQETAPDWPTCCAERRCSSTSVSCKAHYSPAFSPDDCWLRPAEKRSRAT